MASVAQNLTLNVLDANGAPQFAPAETWHILEGQPLQVGVFAYDPDNPDFEPKIRLTPTGVASGGAGTSSVRYHVDGLPRGARFDEDTMEIDWTPDYTQAGTWWVTVTATDDGGGTATPLSSQLTLPIVVEKAYRAPTIGSIASATVDKGAVLNIPISANDPGGEPVTLTVSGLPRFATFTQTGTGSNATAVLHFAPGSDDRGDYTITVTAQNDGGDDPSKALATSTRFVLSATSLTEPPIVSVAPSSVAIVGQQMRLAIVATDPDQDALSYAAQGLPAGAQIVKDALYGLAYLVWTPTVAQLGNHDISLSVTDSGLPPVNAGIPLADDFIAHPNTVVADLRIVVRQANSAPATLAVQTSGGQITAGGVGSNTPDATTVNASEGVPLAVTVLVRDADFDALNWTVTGMPAGMTMQRTVTSDGQENVVLHWTPGTLAAQTSSIGDPAGAYHITLRATDGVATAIQTITLHVANTNQAPLILQAPLQLVHEGDTLGFTMQSIDPDGGPVTMSLVHDQNTPAGVQFDATTGYVEWTPGLDTVDNLNAKDGVFNLTFAASDGQQTTLSTVQVRVLDVDRAPQVWASSHALVVGQTIALPVIKSTSPSANSTATGIRVADADGVAQTQALVIAFDNLPQGAHYDAVAGQLIWTPGPGQLGDFTVTARVSDGLSSTTQTFTLRVVADATAIAPSVVIDLTPATPVLPGQTVLATVRADSYGALSHIATQVRGIGPNAADWTDVVLDGAGRVRFTTTTPGLVDIRVTATDIDGFSTTRTQTIRVRDPQDMSAPVLTWGGALQGNWGSNGDALAPVTLTHASLLQAAIADAQLMQWQLQLAPVNGSGPTQWTTLADQSAQAIHATGQLDLATLDPAAFANGVYQLRLTAWDLAGRASEIGSRVVIDSSTKTFEQASVTDAVFQLGGHALALTRTLTAVLPSPAGGRRAGDEGVSTEQGLDFGNWTLPLLDTHLTQDQPATDPQGATAAWREGARVWLQIPASLGIPQAAMQYLSFTLGTTSQALSTGAANIQNAPTVFHPAFSVSNGWTLQATTFDAQNGSTGSTEQPVSLQRQGQRLYDEVTGLPWQPEAYTLTGPDGTRYNLDANGKITAVQFTDGRQWLVSDAGIALVGADPNSRITFKRNPNGEIINVTGPISGPLNDDSANTQSIAYRYDTQGRLILARTLGTGGTDTGTQIGYHDDGSLITDPVTANLGALVNWITSGANAATNPSNAWSGSINTGTPINLSFTVRASELASAVKTPGATGSVILAVTTQGSDVQLASTGATILGSTRHGDSTTTMLRVTQAGMKLLTLQGSGNVQVRIALAGDLNHDGNIDGSDSALFEQALASNDAGGDLDGNGIVTSADRQILYANFGVRSNQAPGASTQDLTSLLRTHTDLNTSASLNAIAPDLEGDTVFWRVVGATHGTAHLASDGQTLLFTPDAGYAGHATVTVQADDGFAAGAPIELGVEVSGAQLVALHLQALPSLQPGEAVRLHAVADFTDATGVSLDGNAAYLNVAAQDIAPLGYVGASAITIDQNTDTLRATAQGSAMITASHTDADGHTVQTVTAFNTDAASVPVDPNAADDESDSPDPIAFAPDLYPTTLTLEPGGTRQIKVRTADGGADAIYLDYPTGTRYVSSDERIATVDAHGVITATTAGEVTISVIHLTTDVDELGNVIDQGIGQSDITLTVQAAQVTDSSGATSAPRSVVITAAHGGAVSDTTGETVLIGAGALANDASVSINRINIDDLEAVTGMPAPAQGALETVGAFHLDIGTADTQYPLQAGIPIQGSTAQLGEEVLFLRKGTVPDPDLGHRDTWWVVDNGFIGADAQGNMVARTASPPYGGLDSSGEYIVMHRLPGVVGGTFDLIGGGGITFGGMSVMAGAATSNMIAIAATMAATATAFDYHFGVPQFAKDIVIPQIAAGDTFTLNMGEVLPDASTPWGNVVLPNITNAAMTDAGQLRFTPTHGDPGVFKGTVKLRALFSNGTHQDVMTIADNGGDITIDPATLALGTSIHFAISSALWQLVRIIPTDELTSTGKLHTGEPIEFAGNTIRIAPRTDMAAVLNRNGVTFIRKQDQTEAGHTNLVNLLGDFNNLNGTYVTGTKVQPVVFTDDLSSVYVGGNGVVYQIDMLTFKVINTITVPAGKNIASLATTGSLLLIGEGSQYGGTGNRLLAMDINPGSANYDKAISLKGTGIDSAPLGIAGMVIGPDGKTLVVSAPKNANSVMLGNVAKRGNILVFDLDTLDLEKGTIAAPVTATLPADSISGKAAQVISATHDANRYLIADVADYNRGLSTLVIMRDGTGKIASAKMTAIEMTQTQVDVDRLNIQRAQSAVLVEKDGVEYAIVSDDNYNFLDPYYNAMYEAPNFVYTPDGPPLAFGGSASAKKVAVGGKLGLVRDPFGKNGAPQYLGATLPLDGYGIVNLSVSEDGKVLLGQLKGGYGSLGTPDANTQKPNQNHVWNVDSLIAAALAMSDRDRMTQHIKLPSAAEQLIAPANGAPVFAPAGTFFDGEPVEVSAEGRMGDVVGVDLQELAARQLISQENKRQEPPVVDPEDMFKSWNETTEETKKLIDDRMQHLSNFSVPKYFLDSLSNRSDSTKPQMELVTKKDKDGKLVPVSRLSEDSGDPESTQDADFEASGILFFAPVITAEDENRLRLGQTLADKFAGFVFYYTDDADTNSPGEEVAKTGFANVTAKDYVSRGVFFGDRDLKNPGYSAFKLKGDVSAAAATAGTIDTLDVYRVEQRLKYLGFPAMGSGYNSSGTYPKTIPVGSDPTIYSMPTDSLQDEAFKVDGKWEQADADAALLFSRVINYGTGAGTRMLVPHTLGHGSPTSNGPYFNSIEIAAKNFATNASTLNYLNAYNAPHWMKIGQVAGWNNLQTAAYPATQVENYATSWMRDLMLAKQFSPAGLKQSTSTFNGATDANHGYTPFQHGSHDLGMAFDLKISQYILGAATGVLFPDPLTTAVTQTALTNPGQWSNVDAISLVNAMPHISGNEQNKALADFLSLYTATQKGVTGSRDDLTLQIKSVPIDGKIEDIAAKQDKVVNALFGDGTQSGGLISGVIIGGNPVLSNANPHPKNSYLNIHYALQKLGFHEGNVDAMAAPSVDKAISHHNHFHVYLRPPKPTAIETSKQLNFAPTPLATVSLVDDALVLIKNDSQVITSRIKRQIQRLLNGACIDLEHETLEDGQAPSARRMDTPGILVAGALTSMGIKPLTPIVTRIVKPPKHGQLNVTHQMTVESAINGGEHFEITSDVYLYTPDTNYLGKDSVTYEVEANGHKFTVMTEIRVITKYGTECPSDPEENGIFMSPGVRLPVACPS